MLGFALSFFAHQLRTAPAVPNRVDMAHGVDASAGPPTSAGWGRIGIRQAEFGGEHTRRVCPITPPFGLSFARFFVGFAALRAFFVLSFRRACMPPPDEA